MPSGKSDGHRSESWPFFGTGVILVGVPPSAETRMMALLELGANRIRFELPQVPPRPFRASQIATGAPPFASIRNIFPFAKNPMAWPSGDQNGRNAPSVPGSSIASSLSIERIQREVLPSRLATNAIRVPSGDRAGGPFRLSSAKCVPSGGSKVPRTTCGACCPRHQTKTRATARIRAVAASSHLPRSALPAGL